MAWLLGYLRPVFGFLVILGPLVVVHEFGHFMFARLFGVKAEIFSIGFGPRLFARKIGETEWRLSAIPLGGYVKLLGEDAGAELSPEDAKRALGRQPAWKRFFIFFGGPLFNFLFAIFVFMMILVIGEPQISSVAGRIVRHSSAEKAGFRSGDRIDAVDGKPVRKFEDVAIAINESPGKAMQFTVVHSGAQAPTLLTATPMAQTGFTMYGESTHVGEIDGLQATPRGTEVGVSDPSSLAGKAGVHTGDQIAEFAGKPVSTWEEIDALFGAAPAGSAIGVKIRKAKSAQTVDLSFTKPAAVAADQGPGEVWGLRSSELFVEKVVPGSPAETAGVKSADRLVGVGGQDVESFYQLKDLVQKSGEADGKVRLRWERDGKPIQAQIVPTSTAQRDPALRKTTQFTVGVMPMLMLAEPATFIERTWNPFTLVFKATERMAVATWRNLVSIRKMFTGDVSVGTLGGPIMIGKIAGESLSRGLISFLLTMAILSVGLGVLNVLPVPVLDGGHLLLLAIEAIRGKPLTLRQMEVIQTAGLILILSLMAVVIKNDVTRLF